MNMHGMQANMNVSGVSGHSPMMQPGMSPVMMQQVSPQQPTPNVMGGPSGPLQQPVVPNLPQQQQAQSGAIAPMPPQPPQSQQQQQQQQPEKLDNISKVKSLFAPLRESLYITLRAGAFTLQQNNLADNLKRDTNNQNARFDKNLEEFFGYCDHIEMNLNTAIHCTQQLGSAQHYLPGAVMAARMEPYMQDNPNGPMSYTAYLNTVRVHLQTAKDIHDTLISAAQNISQVD